MYSFQTKKYFKYFFMYRLKQVYDEISISTFIVYLIICTIRENLIIDNVKTKIYDRYIQNLLANYRKIDTFANLLYFYNTYHYPSIQKHYMKIGTNFAAANFSLSLFWRQKTHNICCLKNFSPFLNIPQITTLFFRSTQSMCVLT